MISSEESLAIDRPSELPARLHARAESSRELGARLPFEAPHWAGAGRAGNPPPRGGPFDGLLSSRGHHEPTPPSPAGAGSLRTSQ
jgi:hypothetical protein